MLHAMIMAGGSGTRFWPASRRLTPKQLLPVVGDEPMLAQTVARLQGLVEPQRILVATNIEQADAVRECVPSLPGENVIAEPACRDTAPCIGLAAHIVLRRDPDAVLIVLPSDHVISPREDFQSAISVAGRLAEEDMAIFVFGVPPAEPSTGYGYIQRGARLCVEDGISVYRTARFTEKPDAPTARAFLDSGDYYWNSGLYLFRADAVLKELAAHAPELAKGLSKIAEALGTDGEESVINEIYPCLEKISIDYAVTEKATEVKVVEVGYDWNDIGSWTSLRDAVGADEDGNVVRGRHCAIDTADCIIRGNEEHTIATVGVSDLIIIHTGDATLVCASDRAQDVKALVEKLRTEGRDDLL